MMDREEAFAGAGFFTRVGWQVAGGPEPTRFPIFLLMLIGPRFTGFFTVARTSVFSGLLHNCPNLLAMPGYTSHARSSHRL